MNNPGLTKTFVAGGAIAKRRIVAFGAGDGLVVQAQAATDALIGVAADLDAASGARVDVHLSGVVEVEFGGTVTRGALVSADATGKAVAATRHTHSENAAGTYTQDATTGAGSTGRVIGVAMASAVAGDIAGVLLSPNFA